jgi:glycerol-3-phosphate acyltransferase PlsY
VATFLGTLIAAAWPAGLAAGATWLLIAFVFRFSSLAGLAAAALSPLLVWWLDPSDAGKLSHIWLAAFMAVLIFVRHQENIRRLLRGEEPRIGASARGPATADGVGHNGGPPLA